jgi:hypothetical protein
MDQHSRFNPRIARVDTIGKVWVQGFSSYWLAPGRLRSRRLIRGSHIHTAFSTPAVPWQCMLCAP